MIDPAGQDTLPSVTESLDRVVDGVQKVVGSQLDLFRLDVSSAATSALLQGAMAMGGILFLIMGWGVFLVAAYWTLEPSTGALPALAVLGTANVVVGLSLLAGTRREVARE
jgi:uncharacterized membrane protein YqjE